MTLPTIYVLSRPSFTDEYMRFLGSEGYSWAQASGSPAERLVEFAGRICYMSFGSRQSPKTNDEYIQNLIRQGHESVIEHVNWTFLLAGVTRAFTHQLVRHRVGMSFSQLSQQYHDESDSYFLPPEGLEKNSELFDVWREAVESSHRAYKRIASALLSKDGNAKEVVRAMRSAARSVLPNAIETKIVVTANARAIRHFLAVRGNLEGDIEMRRVSKLLFDMISGDAPSIVYDFKSEVMPDQTPIIRKLN